MAFAVRREFNQLLTSRRVPFVALHDGNEGKKAASFPRSFVDGAVFLEIVGWAKPTGARERAPR
jgi:hypothetical protein